MVSLWYPAAKSDGPPAPYMSPAESELQLVGRGITHITSEALSTVQTNAVSSAAPAGRQRSLPLVVLSPGYTDSRSTLTALAEDLASHGYVAAGIDHTYESRATAFPDGRIATCLSREARRPGSGFWEKVVAGRAADVSFVLSEWHLGAGLGLMRGWKRWLVMAGAVHASFTDLGLLADQLGIDIAAVLPGTRSLDIIRAYVRAFFDHHLRGEPQALLDQPSASYPEVTFCSP
jgi:hypothetical protein